MELNKKSLENVSLDYNDEWQINDENGTVDVMFTGMEALVYEFFGVDPDDDACTYVDSYAVIDPKDETVIKALFKLVAEDEEDSEWLEVAITDPELGKAFFDKFRDNDGGFDKFVKEAKEVA